MDENKRHPLELILDKLESHLAKGPDFELRDLEIEVRDVQDVDRAACEILRRVENCAKAKKRPV